MGKTKIKTEVNMNNEFENKHISFSGEMKKDGIYEMAQEAIKLGAIWDENVTAETDILVRGKDFLEKSDESIYDKNSRLAHDYNVTQAKNFKIKIISENEFFEKINN